MDDHNPWHSLLYNAGVRIAVIGVFAILALFLAAETISLAENFGRPAHPASDTITVSGDGPDVARVSFTVDNSAKAVADAQAATTKQANDAIAWIKGQGIAGADIRTESYQVTPQYSSQGPCAPGALCPAIATPTIVGYDVSESVQVTVRDLTTVGALLQGLGTRGVQNVSGPDFALDDPSAGYDAARADAIDKAKAQATLLSNQLGVSLGKIVNFSETSGGSPMPVYGMAAGATAARVAAPSVPAGENTYYASVSITYEIR